MNEASVRYIQFGDKDPRASGVKLAVCLRGRKYATCVVNYDTGISLEQFELREFDKMRCVPGKGGQPYDPKTAALAFLAFTRRQTARRDITKGAREVLDRILDGAISESVVEPTEETVEAAPIERRTTVLANVCAQLKLDPPKARKILRAAGLHAPYDDAAKLIAVLSK